MKVRASGDLSSVFSPFQLSVAWIATTSAVFAAKQLGQSTAEESPDGGAGRTNGEPSSSQISIYFPAFKRRGSAVFLDVRTDELVDVFASQWGRSKAHTMNATNQFVERASEVPFHVSNNRSPFSTVRIAVYFAATTRRRLAVFLDVHANVFVNFFQGPRLSAIPAELSPK